MNDDLTTAEIERFHARIDHSGACWTWSGELNNQGYGRFTIWRGHERRRLLAHRLAYLLSTGTDPGESFVRHGCDNPPCVRPDHLSLGTQTDNMRDASARGRVNLVGLDLRRARQGEAARARRAAGVKSCANCRVEKPLTEFHVSSRDPDGRASHCAQCRNTRAQAERMRNEPRRARGQDGAA